jgi:hypothetical protein
MDFICNICGYPNLRLPPRDETGASHFNICPCCGCEFGYEDATPLAGITYRKNGSKMGLRGLIIV